MLRRADPQRCLRQVEHRYGLITGMFALYRGESYVVDDIEYLNMEEYLRRLA